MLRRKKANIANQLQLQIAESLVMKPLGSPFDSVDLYFNQDYFDSQNIKETVQEDDNNLIESLIETKNRICSDLIQQKPCDQIKSKNTLQEAQDQEAFGIQNAKELLTFFNDDPNKYTKKELKALKVQQKFKSKSLKEIAGFEKPNSSISLIVHHDGNDVQPIRKKIKDKKEKLQVRLLFYFNDPASKFNYEIELHSIITDQIKIIDYDIIFQDFSGLKKNINKKLKINKKINHTDKIYITQFIMLIVKYTIYKMCEEQNKAFKLQLDLLYDIKYALIKEIYQEPLEQIYLILSNQYEYNQIEWLGVINSLKYQLEVSRSFYKSHCCGYSNFIEQYQLENDKKVDKIWLDLNPPGQQSKAGKKKFQQLMERINKSNIKDFTLNHYYQKMNENKTRADVALYIDDLFNTIIVHKEL